MRLFEICFEQAWKAVKEILSDHGYSGAQTGSPKMIIKLAYSAGMINDEAAWINMLKSRNDVARSYNEAVAYGIIEKTKAEYIELFEKLEAEIDARWL